MRKGFSSYTLEISFKVENLMRKKSLSKSMKHNSPKVFNFAFIFGRNGYQMNYLSQDFPNKVELGELLQQTKSSSFTKGKSSRQEYEVSSRPVTQEIEMALNLWVSVALKSILWREKPVEKVKANQGKCQRLESIKTRRKNLSFVITKKQFSQQCRIR